MKNVLILVFAVVFLAACKKSDQPELFPRQLLAGSVAAQDGVDLTSASEPNMLAGAAWTVLLNADSSVTFNLAPILFTGSPFLQALKINIVNEAGTFSQDLTYGSSDGSVPVDELVLANGLYSYTIPAASLPEGEFGIFYMVNGRAPSDGGDLQRHIGIRATTIANDWDGFDSSWANRLKITLP